MAARSNTRWALAGVLFTLAEGYWPKNVSEEVFAMDFINSKMRSEETRR